MIGDFDKVLDRAAANHGGLDGVAAKLAEYPPKYADPATVTDDRALAEMARTIFHTGLSWQVVANKWDGIEAAFEGFDPQKVGAYHDDDLDRLLADERIIRSGAKVSAIIHNAGVICEIAAEHGSFGRYLASWQPSQQVELLAVLQKQMKRLGGSTGPYVLRILGWDSFMLSGDVTTALIREGVIDKPATSKAAQQAVQAAFTEWCEQTGRPQREISRILALSVG